MVTTGQILHYPRLDTVLKVEEVLKETGVPMKKAEIKKKLEKKIMHQTLNLIIDYLEDKGLAADTTRGVQWIGIPESKWRDKMIEAGDIVELKKPTYSEDGNKKKKIFGFAIVHEVVTRNQYIDMVSITPYSEDGKILLRNHNGLKLPDRRTAPTECLKLIAKGHKPDGYLKK